MSNLRLCAQSFDYSAKFMSKAVHSSGRLSCRDYQDITGVTERSAQRYLKDLVALGYLQADEAVPRGYLPTEKAKRIFTGSKGE